VSAANGRVLRFAGGVRRDPGIEQWFARQPEDLGALAREWFGVARRCGDDVRELMHDDQPTACIGDAAFVYVDAFTAHVNVGFFPGAGMDDPQGLLQGTGKYMRHVKLKPGVEVHRAGLARLIHSAYEEMKRRLETASSGGNP
jgi:hypothetical protein